MSAPMAGRSVVPIFVEGRVLSGGTNEALRDRSTLHSAACPLQCIVMLID